MLKEMKYMNKIKVSIVTPFYNQDPTVFKKTVESVFKIFTDEMEWVIVLHNTDNVTVDDLYDLVSHRENIRVFELRNDMKGPASPRNMGISHSIGEYIYLLDDDDVISDSFIPFVIEYIKDKPYDIFIGNADKVLVNDDALPVPLYLDFPDVKDGYLVPDDPEAKGNLLSGVPMFLGCKLIKRSIIADNKICFYDEIKLTEDVLFSLECYVKAKTICVFKSINAFTYKQRSDSLLQRMMREDSFSIDTYSEPVDRIVNIAVSNGISPSSYLWIMTGMFGVIFQQAGIDEAKKKEIFSRIHRYLPYMSKVPPEGLTNTTKYIMNSRKSAEDLNDLSDRFEELINSNIESFKPIASWQTNRMYRAHAKILINRVLTDEDESKLNGILKRVCPLTSISYLADGYGKWKLLPIPSKIPYYYKDITNLNTDKQQEYLRGFFNVFEYSNKEDSISAGVFKITDHSSVLLLYLAYKQG